MRCTPKGLLAHWPMIRSSADPNRSHTLAGICVDINAHPVKAARLTLRSPLDRAVMPADAVDPGERLKPVWAALSAGLSIGGGLC